MQVPDDDLLDANTKHVTCIVIDGPVMVQRLQPGLSATFTDYAQTVVMPYNMGNSPVTDGTFWGFFCPCKVSLEFINNFFPDILIYPKST